MKGQEWTQAVVGHLRILKRQGRDFERAWSDTMLLYPPDSRAHSRDTSSISQYAFFRAACKDAWFGERPKLQWLSQDLLAHGPGSDGTFARRRRRHAA